MKNVLFFSDFGVDDNVAIIYSFFTEEINIVGVVADYGNVSKQDAVRNAEYIQKLTGRKDISVFGGAEIPLTGESPTYYPEVHGLEGFGPFIPDLELTDQFENFEGIKGLIEKYKNDIIIVNVGRLSSLATAFILFPSTMKLVKEFYIMGGAFLTPGNVTPVTEANFFGDPYAANIVINFAPKKLHIVPLDITKSAIVTPALVEKLNKHYEATKNKVGLLVKPMVDYYFKFYKTTDPNISGSPLHDVLTLWAITTNAKISYTEAPTKIIVNTGNAFGQSIADFRETPNKVDWPIHKIALQFDYQSFIQDFYKSMTNDLKTPTK
ncbi:nucleoside hydrolase [Neobacillus sp. D3-1R]|uniref:nucleoside hydrolase n=1 Tax=Neobacillus sp. D3-1R TaxID=3445778 RepID=UPI003FA05B59